MSDRRVRRRQGAPQATRPSGFDARENSGSAHDGELTADDRYGHELFAPTRTLVDSGRWPASGQPGELAATYRRAAVRRRTVQRGRRSVQAAAAVAASVAALAWGTQLFEPTSRRVETVESSTSATQREVGTGWHEIASSTGSPDVAGRENLSTAVLDGGRVALWGGTSPAASADTTSTPSGAGGSDPATAKEASTSAPAGEIQSDGLIIDPNTLQTEAIPAGGIARENRSASAKMVAAGDKLLVYDQTSDLFQTAVYDVDGQRWNDPSNPPPGWNEGSRKSAAIGFDGEVVAVVDPGYSSSGGEDHSPEVWRRPVSDTQWSAGATPPGGTYVGQAVASPDAQKIAFPLCSQNSLSIAVYSVESDSWTTSSLADVEGLDSVMPLSPELTSVRWTSDSTLFVELGRMGEGIRAWTILLIDPKTGAIYPNSIGVGPGAPTDSEAADFTSASSETWSWEQQGGVLVPEPQVEYEGQRNNVFISGSDWLVSALGPPLAADWGFVSTSNSDASPGSRSFEVAIRPYGSDWLAPDTAPFANRAGSAVVVSGGYVVVAGGREAASGTPSESMWVLSLPENVVTAGETSRTVG